MANHNKINNIEERDVVLWVNFIMIGVASLLLFYYVMVANMITTKNYKIQTLRDKLEVLTELNGSLMSRKITLESPTTLLEFARAQSFIEARNIVYIFENKNVAQR